MIGAVVGIGLVSPIGLTPADHAFFRRARVPPRSRPAFVNPDDKVVRVEYCASLGPRVGIVERLAWQARAASATALIQLRQSDGPPPALLLCLSRPRPGFTKEHAADLERALGATLQPALTRVYHGAASAFVALQDAQSMLAEGRARSVLLVGVDSYVDADALAHEVSRAPPRWAVASPPPAEGAAAALIVQPATAQRYGLRVLGTVLAATATQGYSNDDNDEPVDGAALGVAIRSMPAGDPIGMAFGQSGVDQLRLYESQYATARTHARFRPDCYFDCLESDSGRVGAAAGVLHLAFGFAAVDHAVVPSTLAATPFVCWAISRDGTRGLALCKYGER